MIALIASPLACRLIELYQRHLSPRKGFRCAYGVRTGRSSCSQFGKRAIRRTGIVAGIVLLRRRFHRCHLASQTLQYEPKRSDEEHWINWSACRPKSQRICTDRDVFECATTECCITCC
jgi:putative component of membrane protein insertase Oxa1/YidC/SpoIIIJ protein YidD